MRRRRRHRHLERQLLGYGLTTAEIIYRMPDYQDLLQSYIWQEYDKAPDFPELHRFLDFWQRNLDGPIHQVRVASLQLVRPAEFRIVDGELRLH
ncbi:MAG: usg protein [Alphaproteobacteria bacterium]|nr:usg protein [Alphaproteobacteria bacterium]